MASLVSSIRSAARATSSAHRRLPIRWRLAGGSALLTLVILLGFAAAVGALTTQRIEGDFDRDMTATANALSANVVVSYQADGSVAVEPGLRDFTLPGDAVVRVLTYSGDLLQQVPADAPDLPPPVAASVTSGGYRIENRIEPLRNTLRGRVFLQYARPVGPVTATTTRIWVLLALGVLGGSALALLAGLATARRAMAPIAELTEAARRVEQTRDPAVALTRPTLEADDEVAELAATLESMLRSLGEARAESEHALSRQREFVADASHELRTPLTAVLTTLELLAEELDGEQEQLAESALRSSRRMRRLVTDLLLLARADAGRPAVREPVDLAEVVADAAAELGGPARSHELQVCAESAPVLGVRDDLHRLVLNLMENAVRHTDPGTAVEVAVQRANGTVVIAVEDDGPGVPPELREKIFERFVRGSADRGGSSGLGLAIVKAVAEAHGGRVDLVPPRDGRGARFEVRLPAG